MSDFKAYPFSSIAEGEDPEGAFRYLQLDQAARLQIMSYPILEKLGEILQVAKKIEMHLRILTGDTLSDSDVE